MLPIHTVLHPTDFSEHSEHAFRLACALARDYDARLIVLHVWTSLRPVFGEVVPPPVYDYDPAATEAELRQLRPPDPTVRVEHRLEKGDPAAIILRVAEEAPADLIVLGTHGRTGLKRLLMGSVAEQVMRRAACPVVTVKTPFPAREPAASVAESAPLVEAGKG